MNQAPDKSPSKGPAIEVRDVFKVFAKSGGMLWGKAWELRAVDGVSLNVGFGEVFGIVGESGCGKSTLARLILGLLSVSAGEIWVDGRDLATLDRRERARLIQPVFQDPFSSLNPTRSIMDVVGLPLAAQGDLRRDDRHRRVLDMLERVGLSADVARRSPPSSRAASASAWPSRARWCCARAYWSATSPPAR